MSQDIFIPLSKTADAVVGPLDTVTWVTNNSHDLEDILINGYFQSTDGWYRPEKKELNRLNRYLGFNNELTWKIAKFFMKGEGKNINVRVIAVDQSLPCIRSSYDGLYEGGATISSPIVDLSSHETIMKKMGINSTIGIKNMEFQSPAGETYVSSEIVYEGPDNIFILGVTRPEIFIPIGPINNNRGIGGIAYSARCTANTDETISFFKNILGYEIRRDVEFQIDNNSAINISEGVKERFIQGFSPGTSSGYIVLMDHGEYTKQNKIEPNKMPGRGITMWSFMTTNLDHIYDQAKSNNIEILSSFDREIECKYFHSKSLILKDPDGFSIEIFEN